MDSKTRIKDFINNNFPNWQKVNYSDFGEDVEFNKDLSELYKINNEEIILISYTNISITGSDRPKPQLRVFLDEYKRPFYYAKSHQLRFYLFSIFTKEDVMARGLNNFNPKEYLISIETNLDKEDARRDLRSIYDYANENINGRKFLKCTRSNYKADINQASFIYIGSEQEPDKITFEYFINIFDSRPYLNSTDEPHFNTTEQEPLIKDAKYASLLPALRTKPFLLLAGISGTGKSRIVRELAFKSCPKMLQDADLTTPGNYCMIEVKPNWHDSTELLGYYSNISKKYVFTKFVKFLVKAMMFPDVPFFVCLDEMNLAPVEQYFAEFLSVLETRKKVGEHIVSGALVDKQFFNDLAKVGGTEYHNIKTNKEVYQKLWETTDSEGIDSESAASDSLLTVGLTLPDNVFVIGTVNMDDTTHQFSRKVIDRAMTIEMNGGDLKDMFGGSAALNYMPEGEEWKIDQFRPRYVNADEVIEKHSNYAEQIKKQCVEKLQDINTLLKGTPFEVSYRVLNELVIYLGNLLDEKSYPGDGNDEEFKNIVQEAFDAVTLMKILPRVEGDDEMFNLKNEHQNRLQKMQELFSNEESGSRKKLQEMDDRLGQMQFTRFWP